MTSLSERLYLGLLVAGLLLPINGLPSTLVAQVLPIGGAIEIARTNDPPQNPDWASIALRPDGEFLVTWGHHSSLPGTVSIRSYDSDDLPYGPSLVISEEGVARHSHRPNAAARPLGDYVVVWEDDGGNDAPSSIVGKLISEQGLPMHDFEVQWGDVSRRTTGLAVGPTGGFVVGFGWRPSGDIFMGLRAYSVDGLPITDVFSADSDPNFNIWSPSVAKSPSGDFIAAWFDSGEDFDSVYARIFRFDGVPLTPTFTVGTQGNGTVAHPETAAAADGAFVVAWGDGGPEELFYRAYSPTGVPLGPAVQINNPSSEAFDLDIARGAGDEFLIVWGSSSDRLLVRVLDLSEGFLGPEQLIRIGDLEGQPAVAGNTRGEYIVVWAERDYPLTRVLAMRLGKEGLFFDGFESGDTSAWSTTAN